MNFMNQVILLLAPVGLMVLLTFSLAVNTYLTIMSTAYALAIVAYLYLILYEVLGGHGGRVVTLSPPTSEAGVRFLARPQVGKLVVACRWSAVYSTEP